MRLALLLLFALTVSAQPKPVWIDCDPSARPGGHEIDDVVALLQAFHSPELAVRGVSIVFGNADLPTADRIGREVVTQFGPAGLPVFTGAASPARLGQETAASKALAAALRKERLTILVLGPATNVATVFQNHPELVQQAVQVIGVAGRRPGQHFRTSPQQTKPFQDLNFELDPRAYGVLLRSGAPLVLAPWEVSARVPVTRTDIDRAAATSPGVRWLQPAAHDWLAFWRKAFGVPYFNPFDALAVGYAINPALLRCDPVKASIEEAADDTGAKPRKPYLHVSLQRGHTVTYCHTPAPGFHADLLRRLAAK